MRSLERTNAFRRDFKRESRGQLGKKLDALLDDALVLLANDKTMPAKYSDHSLSGEWTDHRECHLKPDLLLIYRKPNEKTLQLVHLGSHSELYG